MRDKLKGGRLVPQVWLETLKNFDYPLLTCKMSKFQPKYSTTDKDPLQTSKSPVLLQ